MSVTKEYENLFEEFGYLISKIENAPMSTSPFEHVIIDDFLSETHFNEVTKANEIKRPIFDSTEDLIDDLLKNGYNVQHFPGCSTSIDEYLKAFNSGDWGVEKGLLEGFGLTFRLNSYATPILKRLIDFLNTAEFKAVIEKKFGINNPNYLETVFQKYLHGYEISPHPDIRKKAATYMLNLNPFEGSEDVAIHTHLLRFNEERDYIYDFWKNNKDIDRCWVPWDWCESEFQTSKNNSIVLFAPSDDTLHAIKLDYDHLQFQRTQIYGNLWYDTSTAVFSSNYHEISNSSIDGDSFKNNKEVAKGNEKQSLFSSIVKKFRKK